MTAVYPVHYSVEPVAGFSRLQLLVRFAAFVALGLVGLSFGAVFLFAYVALPVLAAVRPESRGVALQALRWFAAISAWTGLTTDRIPQQRTDETIHLEVDREPPMTTPRSAILRIFTGFPSALVLGVLCFIGAFVWLWAALSILFSERVGSTARKYLIGLQRWSVRLLAYQGSFVDDYPPFTLEEVHS
ncbi:MAG: DUF4389 domain-containing protein [Myxococcales bacterium]|nr:DUF4389 domain-containing protein [Myxococcales bacterium]